MERIPANYVAKLQAVLKDVGQEDCELLVTEYGKDVAFRDMLQIIYDDVEDSKLLNIPDLIWHLRENPLFQSSVKRNQEGNPGGSRGTWNLARSKSSGTLSKIRSESPCLQSKQRSSSVQRQEPSSSNLIKPVAFSGSKNPLQIIRKPKGMDDSLISQLMSSYLQDKDLRCLMYDIYEKKTMNLLILLRGASGSGKSSLATVLWGLSGLAEVFSADQYFVSRSGQYHFDPNALKEAHTNCKTRAHNAFERGVSPIIIDNTNMRIWEMEYYVELGVDYNYDIKMLEPPTEWRTKASQLCKKNIHGISKSKIEDQLAAFETTTVNAMVAAYKQKLQKTNKHCSYQAEEFDPPPEDYLLFPTSTSLFFSSPPLAPKRPPSDMNDAASNRKQNKSPPLQMSLSEPPQHVSGAISTLNDYISRSIEDNNSGVVSSSRKKSRSGERRRSKNGTPKKDAAVNTEPKTLQFEDPARLAFQTLCKLFPDAGKDETEKIFVAQQCNLDKSAEILLDLGFIMADMPDEVTNIETVRGQINEQVEAGPSSRTQISTISGENNNLPSDSDVDDGVPNRVPTLTDILTPKAPQGSPSGQVSEEQGSELGANYGSGGEDSDVSAEGAESMLELSLPLNFARDLLKNFGHPADENRPLSEQQLQVKLDPTAAFTVFKSLYKNLTTTPTESEEPEASSPEPDPGFDQAELDQITISLCQMELETTADTPDLESIMNIESKLEHHKQKAMEQYTASKRSMAQNVGFCILKKQFSHLDPTIVDEVFCQSQLDVEKATAALKEIAPQSKSVGQHSKRNDEGSTWGLKYNPKDVQLYTQAELNEMLQTYEEMALARCDLVEKIKESYEMYRAASNHQIRFHYINEIRKLNNELSGLTDEMQYYKAIKQNSKNRNDQQLDLHGLQSGGAMRILKEFLQCKVQEFSTLGMQKMNLLIITGRGKHSQKGAVLFPKVEHYLAQREYHFYKAKPGCFNVVLTRNCKLVRDMTKRTRSWPE